MIISYFKTILYSFLSVILITLNAYSQSGKNSVPTSSPTPASTNSETYSLKEKVFKDALKYGDLTVAKDALYHMIALKPEEKMLKDSLTYIYINMGSYKEAILLSREILAANPDNMSILEVRAIAEQSLGLPKESLSDYETLYAKSSNIFHLYQIVTLQYELKRVAECSNSLDKIIADKEGSAKEISIGTATRGQQQNVTLRAAAYNVKGVLALDLKDEKQAMGYFEEALKSSPDFVLAKNNLDYLKTKKEKAPTVKTKTNAATKK